VVPAFREAAGNCLVSRWRTIGLTRIPRCPEVQPALFDRRALDLAQAHDTARAALEHDLTSRIERLERSRTLRLEPPELLLVARARPEERR
jgi:hypothetical protein